MSGWGEEGEKLTLDIIFIKSAFKKEHAQSLFLYFKENQ